MGTAYAYLSEAKERAGAPLPLTAFAGEHGTPAQRMFNVPPLLLCCFFLPITQNQAIVRCFRSNEGHAMRWYLGLTFCAGIFVAAPLDPAVAQSELAKRICEEIRGEARGSFYHDNEPKPDLNKKFGVVDADPWGSEVVLPDGPSKKHLDNAVAILEKMSKKGGTRQALSFLVIHKGRLIAKKYFSFYSKSCADAVSTEKRSTIIRSKSECSTNIHSAAKSILSAAVGIAMGMEEFKDILRPDTKIATLLPEYYKEIRDKNKKNIEVQHLLTMSSGLEWTEDETEHDLDTRDRIRSILKQRSAAPPGTIFKYSTGNSHLLSAVLTHALQKRSPKGTETVCTFVHDNLLLKIGVVADRWGHDLQGYFSGGFDLYLTPRELARFGLLFLNDGKWNGAQIVPKAWVEKSLKQMNANLNVKAIVSLVPNAYGYYFWLYDKTKLWGDGDDERRREERKRRRELENIKGYNVQMVWGYGGQMIYLIKDLNLAVVMTVDTKGRGNVNEVPIMRQLELAMLKHVIPAVEGLQ
jgi:CubicO group peptidase (beta-lactamase class C family)